MIVYPSVVGINEHLIYAARLSGASWLTTLRKVVLPLLVPALFRTFGVTFVLAYGAFITPAALGGPGDITLSRLIGGLLNEGRGQSAVLPALLGIATPVLVVAMGGVLTAVFKRKAAHGES
jgi:ABC-type spermidine/putrescine transport system permease subunit I